MNVLSALTEGRIQKAVVTGGRLPSLSDRPQGSYEEIIMKVPARQLPSIASSYLLYSLLPSDVLIPTRLLSALISNCPRFR
ncbi:hypothetical protein TMatcc_008875 [Talaromyces marneffei ATCC 18224]